MSVHNEPIPLVLGGIAISQHSGPIRQRYEAIGGSTEFRLSGGTGIKLTHWSKTATSASGTGYLDPGFDALDFAAPQELLCVQPRAIVGTSRVFALPAASNRRPDVEPWGWARVGAHWVDTSVALSGDSAELAEVQGASQYRVFWLPRLVIFSDGLVKEFDEGTGLYDWSLEAREV
ncbi:hypothetical protein BWR15_06210 [Pseudomonas sp. T]|nr:hypothetical protein BWR15_06210 [Pseudomonas sp. T]